MTYEQAIEFGVLLRSADQDPDRVLTRLRHAEENGYTLVRVVDEPGEPGMDALTVVGWGAARTSRVRLQAQVTASVSRNPGMIARSVTTSDHLTSGRVDLVLEPGPPPEGPPDDRDADDEATALAESVDAVRELGNVRDYGPARFSGRFHHLRGAEKRGPAHDMPVSLHGDAPAVLELAGRRADGWSTVYRDAATLDAAHRAVDEAARAAGRDPREIRRTVIVTGRFGARDGAFTGGPGEWVDDLVPLFTEHGVSTLLLDTPDDDTVVRFAREVLPPLRAALDAALPHGTAGRRIRPAAVRARRRPGIDYDGVPASIAEVVEPGDLAYATYRAGYLRGGSPGIVLRAATPEQVADALAFARRHPHLPLSRRSAGHGISGRSTNDGGIVIDLSLMNGIEVLDEATRRVRIGPGARWMDVAQALHPYGWALSSGDYGGVGVGGLATAGGVGYLGRAHGLTLDRLRKVRMVLADGSIVDADEHENPDLFWAVRGAGANFGIVTSFEFEALPVGNVGFAQLTQDARDPAAYLQAWGRHIENAPRDLTSFLIMPPQTGGQLPVAVTMSVVASDDPTTVLERLRGIAELSPLYGQSAHIMPYAAVISNAADEAPQSRGEPVSRSGLLRHITPEFAEAAAEVLRSGDVHWFQIRAVGGAINDVPADATAYPHRSANFSVVVMGADDAAVDAQWAKLLPHFEGTYFSFDSSLDPERIARAWPPATLERLRELKAKYDPDGVFDDNYALTPAGHLSERASHA